jgi:hypothetical protein
MLVARSQDVPSPARHFEVGGEAPNLHASVVATTRLFGAAAESEECNFGLASSLAM